MREGTGVQSTEEPAGDRRPTRGLANATVLLCGTGRHQPGSKLADIPAVDGTLKDLGTVLADRCGAPRPRVVSDPPSVQNLARAIREAANEAEHILLLYFVGHGLLDSDGRLFLATAGTNTEGNDTETTALSYDTVRGYVLNSPATAKIVILDCCYSGRAVGTLGRERDVENLAAIEGAYVLTSAGNGPAIAPPRARHTAFSGALIRLLTDGDPEMQSAITLDAIFEHLEWLLPASGYPRPRRRVIGNVNDLALTDNPAYGAPPRRRTLLPPPPSRQGWAALVLLSALAGAATVPFLASALHGGTWRTLPPGVRGELLRERWGLLLLAVTAGLATYAVVRPVARWVTTLVVRRDWRRLRRLREKLLLVVAFLLAALLGSAALSTAAAARVGAATCPTTAHVGVLVPAGSHEPARELARAFERDTADGNFGCPDARLLVYSATAAQIHAALVAGWSDEAHVRIGPRPDVWLPDWPGETREVRAAASATGRTLPIAENRTVASTPMVLAVSNASASAAVGDELTHGTPWPTLLETMRTRGWATVAPDPDTSLGGLARIALYHQTTEPKVTVPSVRTVERHIEQSFDRGGHVLGSDAAGLLCAPGGLRDRTGYLLTEQAVARFNHGDPLGPACARRDDVRLLAVYGSHTPVLDRQAVRFDWPAAGDEQRRAATRFTTWLTGPDGQAALAAVGLRPENAAAATPLTRDWGVEPELNPTRATISPDLVRDVRTRYRLAQRPGRVLVAIDASGSMGSAAPGGSLWTVAARGAQQVTGRLGPRDELGVWSFQGTARSGIRELVPVGPRDRPVRGRPRAAATAQALSGVRPHGPAPLFTAVLTGLAEVGPTTGDRVTAVVILTDGENDNASAVDARQFRSAVTGKGVRVFAVAMGTTGCAAPVLKTITTATAGKCLEADDGTVADQLATIFEAVL